MTSKDALAAVPSSETMFISRPPPHHHYRTYQPFGVGLFFGYRFGYVRVCGPRRQTILRLAESWR